MACWPLIMATHVAINFYYEDKTEEAEVHVDGG